MSNTLNAHLQVDRYGDFLLTDAIRPALSVPIIPRAGYRHGTYRDPHHRISTPVLGAAVSREGLLDAFLALLEPLGDEVEVVIETSHDTRLEGTAGIDSLTGLIGSQTGGAASQSGRGHTDPGTAHRDLCRDAIDRPVLESHLYDFEDLLLNDGCTGLAVLSRPQSMEVQFDEHKLLIVYAPELRPFARILNRLGVRRDDRLKLISEAGHIHSSAPHHPAAFVKFCYRLGVGEPVEPINW